MPLVLSGGARFAGGIQGRAPAAVVAAPAANDSYSMYNSLLLLGNGTNNSQNNTFVDSSTNNFSITRNGNTTQGTFSPYGSNWSNYFDGTGDYLSTPAGACQPGSNSFTFELWFYPNADTSRQYFISSASDYWFALSCNLSGAYGVEAWASSNGTSWDLLAGDGITNAKSANNVLIPNTWNHLAYCRSGSNWAVFVNGVRVINVTGVSGTVIARASEVRNIGNLVPYSMDVNGYLSNVRFVIGSTVYDPTGSTITVPTAPLTAIANTQLLTCQSNRLIDNSTNNFTITKNGDTRVERFSPFSPGAAYSASTIGGSAYFDGTGDNLQIAGNTNLSPGTGDFTVEAWCYPTTIAGSYKAVYVVGPDGDTGLYYQGSIILWYQQGARIEGNGLAKANAWQHLAVSRSSGTTRLFVNGSLVGSYSDSYNYYHSAHAIGSQLNGAAEHFFGYISNARFVKGTAVYTSAFTPPTAPLTAVANTQLLLNYTNAGIIDSAMINNLETLGNAKISTTQSKFGGSSMYFDGTGDFLYVPASSNGVLGNTWTIECWYQATSRSNTYPVIISVTDGNSDYANTIALFDRHNSASSNFSFAVGSGTLTVGTTTVSNGTWYHLALVSNGGVVTLYVNGVSEVSASRTTGSVNKGFYVGANFDYASYPTYLNGYIDDLRVTKGYARYTTTFTPPTAELPGQ